MKNCHGTIRSEMRGGRARWLWGLAVGAALLGAIGEAQAREKPQISVDVPPDQVILGGKTGGVFLIAKPVKDEYDALRARVQTLRAEIVGGEIGSSLEAANQIGALQAELKRVRELIDATKTFIAVGQIVTKSETTLFELAPEKLLFLSGIETLRLVGWDEPGVKCVLEKTVVGADDQPLDEDLAAIRLVHRHAADKSVVGLSPEAWRAAADAFLETPAGKALTPEQLKKREAALTHAGASLGYFSRFQNQAIDIVEIEGLTYQQGNRSLTYEVTSGGRGRQVGSRWQRYASLTIYVPRCEAIGIRGGSAGLEVDGVKSPLIIRGEGNRDFDRRSHVKDHVGSLTIENIALDTLENVHGNVSITDGAELGNSFTKHEKGYRRQGVQTLTYDYRNIDGDFTALLLQVDLQLTAVSGRVDVTNEFGDTQFIVRAPLSAARHRVMSQSGNITLRLAADALDNAPLLAVSECGTVGVSEKAPPLDDAMMMSLRPGAGLITRSFHGVASKSDADHADPLAMLRRVERLEHIAAGDEQTPGFDVLSRAGSVQIEPVAE